MNSEEYNRASLYPHGANILGGQQKKKSKQKIRYFHLESNMGVSERKGPGKDLTGIEPQYQLQRA